MTDTDQRLDKIETDLIEIKTTLRFMPTHKDFADLRVQMIVWFIGTTLVLCGSTFTIARLVKP